MFTLYIYSVQL